MKLTLKTKNGEAVYSFDKPTLISDLLKKHSAGLDLPCGGTGKCGKCKVRVEGELSELSEQEAKHLTDEEIADSVRLACKTYALGDVTIYSYNTIFDNIQGAEEIGNADYVINPPTKDKKLFAAAVDIGTTTVAVSIFALPEGKCLGTVNSANPQRAYGADVMARIGASSEHLCEMQSLIKNQIDALCDKIGVKPDIVCVTGNPTMLHIYAGIDPSPLGVAPFAVPCRFGEWQENTYIPPVVSAFVGADTVTAMLKCSFATSDKTLLLADLGTNGELALLKNGKIYTTSTAAGPAFEGVGISKGMTATEGAIHKVWTQNSEVIFSVLQNSKEKGICGSGILDAARVALELEIADESGYMDDDLKLGDVNFTTADMRSFQLAKAAVRAGIERLLDLAEVTYDEVDKLYICGGFGSFLNVESAAKTGLIPMSLADKATAVGNAALDGAAMTFLTADGLDNIGKIVSNSQFLELSGDVKFGELFIEYMCFD